MKRIVLGVALPVGWLLLAVVPFLVAWDRLPEPLASHWSLGGVPNGAMSRTAAIALHGGAGAIAAIVAWCVTRPGARLRSASALCGLAAFVGSLFALIALAVVGANLDAPTWRAARPLPIPIDLAIVASACAITAVVSRGARAFDALAAPIPPEQRATVGLRAGERAAWTGAAHNGWFAVITVAAAAAGAVGGLFGRPSAIAIVPAAITALTCAFFIELHARVDDRGLTIAFGPWQFPRMRIAIDRIETAQAIEIEPWARGGWGYRGSLSLFGRAAVIVRRGEGIELGVDGGKVFVLSIDDAAAAAGLLNDLVARGHSSRK